MISITVNGDSAEAIQAELRTLLNGEAHYTREVGTVTTASQTATVKPASGRARNANAAKNEAAAQATQAISTGEERTDPEVDKQDAADEKAETVATKAVDLTHDDVKKLLGGYVMAYGMEAAQADGTGFIGAPKISEIPNTQAALAAAIIGIAKGINGNPNKRELNGDGLSAEKTAELKVIVTAAMAVK